MRHRRVRAARHRNSRGDEAPRGKHGVGALPPVVADIAVAELPEERRLHRGHDALCADARLQIGGTDAAVLDPMAQPLARGLALRAGQRVEGLEDGAIADRVHRALEARAVRLAEQVVEIGLTPVEDAGVLAVGVVGLAGGRGGPARGAVRHHLEGAHLQPRVAEPGANTAGEQPQQRVLATVHGGEGIEPDVETARSRPAPDRARRPAPPARPRRARWWRPRRDKPDPRGGVPRGIPPPWGPRRPGEGSARSRRRRRGAGRPLDRGGRPADRAWRRRALPARGRGSTRTRCDHRCA